MPIQPIEVKPGIASTEFWLTIAVNLAAILGAVSQIMPPKWAGVLMLISTTLYTVARTWTKTTITKANGSTTG